MPSVAREGSPVAARAQRLERLADGARRRGRARAPRAAARGLARPRPAEDRRDGVRLSLRSACRRADRRLARGTALPAGCPAASGSASSGRCPVSITAAGVFAGLPSVAHAEALLRSIDAARRSSSISRSTRFASVSRARPRTCRASGPIRCSPPTSGWASPCACGVRRRRSPTAGPRSSSTASIAASRIRHSCRTARSSRRPAAGSIPSSSRRRSGRLRPIERALDGIARGRTLPSAAAVRRLGGRSQADGAAGDGDRRRLPRCGRERGISASCPRGAPAAALVARARKAEGEAPHRLLARAAVLARSASARDG